jgi:enoyl-CoA hydratase
MPETDAPKRYTPEGFEVPPPSENDVLYDVREPIAWITFNRPLVLNAVDWSLTYHFGRAIDRAAEDDEVRAVIVRGNGRAFCAGGDLQASPRPEDLEPLATFDVVMRMWDMPKPVIAAVHGYAVGQGCEIAGMCDLTIASEDAQFGEIQIRHGYSPPMLISPFLAGLKGAKELMLTGDLFGAHEAQRLGLVNRVVPRLELEHAAEELARRLAALPPATVALNKRLVNHVYELAGFREAMRYRNDPELDALEAATRSDSMGTERMRTLREQGWEAFKQERDAAFRGQR